MMAGGLSVWAGGATIDGSLTASSGLTVTTGGLLVTNGGATVGGILTASNGLRVASAGLSVTAGGLSVTAGGLAVATGGLTVATGGLTVTAGGLSVTAGGLTVTAGGLQVCSLVFYIIRERPCSAPSTGGGPCDTCAGDERVRNGDDDGKRGGAVSTDGADIVFEHGA